MNKFIFAIPLLEQFEIIQEKYHCNFFLPFKFEYFTFCCYLLLNMSITWTFPLISFMYYKNKKGL